MISININESKKLRFKISLSGVQPQDLKGSMRMMIEEIEYGFPIKIENGDIVVEVNSISNICSKKIKDGSLSDAKLEVVAGDHYLVPWRDKIKLENPVKIEAKVEDIAEEIKKVLPKIKVSDVSEENNINNKEDIKNDEKIEEKKDKKKSKFSKIFK